MMTETKSRSTHLPDKRMTRGLLGAGLLALLLLAGCQADSDAEDEAVLPETASPLPAAQPPAAAPETERAARAQALSQALAERQDRTNEGDRLGQREGLRDQMLERRREVLSGRDDDAVSSPRRSLSPRSNWWEDETLAEQLALSERQIERVAAAAGELERVRTRSRQALATGQRELIQALASESPEAARDLIDQRRQRAIDLATAEAAWLEALIASLTPEQLATLVSQHPQLIMGRGSVGAGER